MPRQLRYIAEAQGRAFESRPFPSGLIITRQFNYQLSSRNGRISRESQENVKLIQILRLFNAETPEGNEGSTQA